MFTMLNRMCWNSRGWLLPTNTSTDGGYPSQMGYGVEEWNFQLDDAVDGYVFGCLVFKKPAEKIILQSDGHYRIGFWGIHPETRQRLLVGLYDDAELSTEDDLKIVDQVFLSKKIYERRAHELFEVVGDLTFEDCIREVHNAVKDRWLSFKCPVAKVHHLPQYIPLSDFSINKTIGEYFTRPTYINPDELPGTPILLSSITQGGIDEHRSAPLAEDAYYRESKEKLAIIIPRHNKLSNSFADWLDNQGYQKIVREENYVDVTFASQGATFLAELKVCYGVGSTKSIREALGQLFEYNYYGVRNPADYWIILLDEKASQTDIKYINKIKRNFDFPLYLGWREGGGFTFTEILPR